MSDELDAQIRQVTQLAIGCLQRRQVFRTDRRVQIARLDARKLCQVVDHLLGRCDVVIDEWNTLGHKLTRKITLGMSEIFGQTWEIY